MLRDSWFPAIFFARSSSRNATSDRLQPLIYGFAGTGLAVQRVGVVIERIGGSLRKLVQSRESSGGEKVAST